MTSFMNDTHLEGGNEEITGPIIFSLKLLTKDYRTSTYWVNTWTAGGEEFVQMDRLCPADLADYQIRGKSGCFWPKVKIWCCFLLSY